MGDYVVHVDHGIGVYQGLKQLEVGESARDFMLLTYQDDARLYVPLERLDLVEKYRSSGEGVKPQVDRLGEPPGSAPRSACSGLCATWRRNFCASTRKGKCAAERPCAPDNNWQKEFEDSFPFQETPDQLTALADIKRDLESS